MVRVRIRIRFGVRFRVRNLGLGHSRVLARCASGLDPIYLIFLMCLMIFGVVSDWQKWWFPPPDLSATITILCSYVLHTMCIFLGRYVAGAWFILDRSQTDGQRTERQTEGLTVRMRKKPDAYRWFTLWFTLCSPTSRSTNQRGLGLSGLVHEEAHPTVPNTC